jgi:prophage regulatory protein
MHQKRFLANDEVLALTGLSRTTIWRLTKTGEFPASVKISARRVAWDIATVEAWAASRLNSGASQ